MIGVSRTVARISTHTTFQERTAHSSQVRVLGTRTAYVSGFEADQYTKGRINYFFKFTGPSYSIDTACSSSLSALHVACNSLWKGDVDTAIVGGTNVLTNPDMFAGLDRGHFLSATGNCKTFDASADGYCRGEGVATIILKRLEDAIEDRDPIHAIVSSAYTNHSAEAESITRPHIGAQKDIFERVLNDSGTHPHEVNYIEMVCAPGESGRNDDLTYSQHGTGTQAGDSREMQSVMDIFAPENVAVKRSPAQALHLGALKSNIGHGESVSGVSALIKVIMMLKNQTIPPHCGIKTTMNPKFPSNMKERNVHIDLEPTRWESIGDAPRKAIINNFSAAGGNCSVLVEEAVVTQQVVKFPEASDRPTFPVAVSGRTLPSFKANVRAMLDCLAGFSGQPDMLEKLSYTSAARRTHHAFRMMVSAFSVDDARSKLETALESNMHMQKPVPPKGMVFAFTGQGCQYPGMGKQLFQSLSVFREHLESFDSLCVRLGFPHILPLFEGSAGANIADYTPTVVQLANTCMQIALAKVWIAWGITPTAVVGHSLGEYAALNVAGVLSDADTLYLVGRRAELLQEKCDNGSHAMLAVMASVQSIEDISKNYTYQIACINAPEETVLAGTVEQMSQMQQLLTKTAIRNTLLKVPYAFHSSQVSPIQEPFKSAAKSCEFQTPRIPVISPLLHRVVTEPGVFGPEYLSRHAREPVGMLHCIRAAAEAKIIGKATSAIEFGPHPVVSGMIRATLGPEITVLPTLRRNNNPWDIMTQTLATLYNAGVSIKWDEYYRDLGSAKTVVALPAYQWDLQSHWIKYKNGWSLIKGDNVPGPLPLAPLEGVGNPVLSTQRPAPVVVEAVPQPETSSVHKVLSESASPNGFSITTESDVSRADINPLMQGHTVEGIGLCTPSVYADIAFTIGEYVLKRCKPAFPERTVDVADMNVEKALIASDGREQFLRFSADFDWSAKEANGRFYTVTVSGHNSAGNQNTDILLA
jgi:acyl transferase domain-containing protein